MNKFMPYNMAELAKRSGRGNNNTAFNKFKKTAHSFRNKTGSCVGLLKMKMSIIEDKRNSAGYDMIKFFFKLVINFFGIKCTDFRNLFCFIVIVYIEIICVQNLPIKFIVLNFISSKKIKLPEAKLR